MASGNRYLWKKRSVKQKRIRAPYLESCPQKKAVCSKVYTTKPKKPNSAIRKVAKVFILSIKKSVIVSIPGQGHNLQEHSVILMRGGRRKDLPGVHYRAIRGVYDFLPAENFSRFQRRSKFGIIKNFVK
jgi:small subunit ribosomal protein S12